MICSLRRLSSLITLPHVCHCQLFSLFYFKMNVLFPWKKDVFFVQHKNELSIRNLFLFILFYSVFPSGNTTLISENSHWMCLNPFFLSDFNLRTATHFTPQTTRKREGERNLLLLFLSLPWFDCMGQFNAGRVFYCDKSQQNPPILFLLFFLSFYQNFVAYFLVEPEYLWILNNFNLILFFFYIFCFSLFKIFSQDKHLKWK